MPAKAGIHAFLTAKVPTPLPSGQKSFLVLFFKKERLASCHD
jgi:hypothetical protein